MESDLIHSVRMHVSFILANSLCISFSFLLLLGDEIDGKDEAMLPSDFTTAGALLDDHVYEKFVLPMREGVHVVSLVSLSGNRATAENLNVITPLS